MGVGLGKNAVHNTLFCDDEHQPVHYAWNVNTGYDCPLCNVVDHEEYADEQNEKLINELDKLDTLYRRLQRKNKEVINYLKDQAKEEEYFSADVTREIDDE